MLPFLGLCPQAPHPGAIQGKEGIKFCQLETLARTEGAPSNCLLISVSANKSSLGRRRRASPPLHCTAVHRTPPLKRATQSPSLSSFVFPRPLKSPFHSLLRATTWTFLRDRMCSKKSTQARKCSKGNPASFLRYRMFSASSFVSLEVEQTAGCLT